ncbi:MAG: hypothetical protein HC827_07330 [Cyanobacteria bacterium RM1_2_2]|nr:hypothetical protein [Cyanobacteria bacterium RM1_2_2]
MMQTSNRAVDLPGDWQHFKAMDDAVRAAVRSTHQGLEACAQSLCYRV